MSYFGDPSVEFLSACFVNFVRCFILVAVVLAVHMASLVSIDVSGRFWVMCLQCHMCLDGQCLQCLR